MADFSKISLTFVVCTDSKCQYQNVVLDQNKPPKFCSLCRKELPPPSADHIDESVKKLQKPQTERVFGNPKPATDLSLDKKSNTSPSYKKPPDKLPIQESHGHEALNDKDDDKSHSEGSDHDKSPSTEPRGNKPPDDKPFGDKPTGTKANDKLSTDKSPSEKPTHNPPSIKPCGHGSSGDKHDDNKLVRNNRLYVCTILLMYNLYLVIWSRILIIMISPKMSIVHRFYCIAMYVGDTYLDTVLPTEQW